MKLRHSLSRRDKFLILALVLAYFVLAGSLMQPVNKIGSGLLTVIREPDFLITDCLVIGGVGASFLNIGLLTLVGIGIIYSLGMEMDGHTIASTLLIFDFSLFGKDVLNIWSILFNVFLYTKYHKTSVLRYIYIGFYGTNLSPIITQVMQIGGTPAAVGFLLGLYPGIIIGFVLPPLCTHVHCAHRGYSLYNAGFAGGIIATVVVSLFKSLGLNIQSRLVWFTGRNREFFVLLTVLFVGTMVIDLAASLSRAWEAYREILRTNRISGTDYMKSEGLAPTLLDMGVSGLFATILVVAVDGDLDGPTIGGIFTIIGFSSMRKYLRNIAPVMLGVCLANLAKSWSLANPSPILALLLSTILAPIAREFGFLTEILAGFFHSSVALDVGVAYGDMNLHDNEFAGGIVAIFLVPVIQSIRDRRARARDGLSL